MIYTRERQTTDPRYDSSGRTRKADEDIVISDVTTRSRGARDEISRPGSRALVVPPPARAVLGARLSIRADAPRRASRRPPRLRRAFDPRAPAFLRRRCRLVLFPDEYPQRPPAARRRRVRVAPPPPRDRVPLVAGSRSRPPPPRARERAASRPRAARRARCPRPPPRVTATPGAPPPARRPPRHKKSSSPSRRAERDDRLRRHQARAPDRPGGSGPESVGRGRVLERPIVPTPLGCALEDFPSDALADPGSGSGDDPGALLWWFGDAKVLDRILLEPVGSRVAWIHSGSAGVEHILAGAPTVKTHPRL